MTSRPVANHDVTGPLVVLPKRGDVIVVHDHHSLPAAAIRFGEALSMLNHGHWPWERHSPADYNHVIIAHHMDAGGTYWGIEGRPNGGIGWVDIGRRGYLTDPLTLTNAGQLITDDDRDLVATAASALMVDKDERPRYDWPAIINDGLMMVDPLYRPGEQWKDGVPTQYVCSSYAAYVYQRLGYAAPAGGRYCWPSNWAAFELDRGWK